MSTAAPHAITAIAQFGNTGASVVVGSVDPSLDVGGDGVEGEGVDLVEDGVDSVDGDGVVKGSAVNLFCKMTIWATCLKVIVNI